MSDKKSLFLLDAYALIYRGYYAFIKNPRINSKGLDTSAILGFMNSLLEIIRSQKPDYIGVAFDKGGSVSRTEMFVEYKSNRDKTPEPIIMAIPYIKNILEGMNIPILEKEGFEADDIIGTVAKKAEKKNFKVFMVTPDKDFSQLVSENIFLCKPARMGNGMEIWGTKEVNEKFEIESPDQVIDFLGMMGDSVDNIPGLPGVGEKTAKKFLKEYGSLENLLSNSHLIPGKLGEKITNNKELGIISKELAKIILDVPIDYNLKDFKLTEPDQGKVLEVFNELEFRRIKETFFKIFGISGTSEIFSSLQDSCFTIPASIYLFDSRICPNFGIFSTPINSLPVEMILTFGIFITGTLAKPKVASTAIWAGPIKVPSEITICPFLISSP